MKKHQLEKIIKDLKIKAEVVGSEEGYFVRFNNHEIVSLPMREVIDGKEKFIDKWAIYPIINGDRDSTYLTLHKELTDAIKAV